jgi:hypothetical protein
LGYAEKKELVPGMNHLTKYHNALGGDRDEGLVDQQRLLAVTEDGVDVELAGGVSPDEG